MRIIIELENKDITPASAQALAAFLNTVEVATPKKARRTKAEIAADQAEIESAAAAATEATGSVNIVGPSAAPNGGSGTDRAALEEQVRVGLRMRQQNEGRDAAVAVLKTYGATSVSALTDENLPEILKELAT